MDLYEVTYLYKGVKYTNKSFVLDIIYKKNDDTITLDLLPKDKIEIVSCRINLEDKMHNTDLFFSNGYQSWTDTQEQHVGQKTKKMGFLDRFVEKTYHLRAYGDYDFIEYHHHYSFSYTYLRNKEQFRLYGSLSERSGYTVFYISKTGHLFAYKDNKGLIIDSPYQAFNIFFTKGNERDVFDKYCLKFNKGFNKPPKLVGYTSWYRHYQNISQEVIEKDLHDAVEKKLPFKLFQIDDGYQESIGDWLLIDKKKFPSGLEPIAKKIKDNNMMPGLWLAPFCGSKNSTLFKNHPDWFIKNEKGEYIYQGANWDGTYVLDFHLKEVKDYLHEVFTTLKGYGFKLFKLDFLYAVTLKIHKDETRGQLMQEAMDFLRKELEGCYIIGCGVPLFPAFFNVDYCRIGMDISLKWDDVFYMRFLHRERISSKLTVRNTRYRAHLNNRFFKNDPDVFLLKGTQMSEEQKRFILETDRKYADMFLTSDDMSLYTEEDIKLLNELAKE